MQPSRYRTTALWAGLALFCFRPACAFWWGPSSDSAWTQQTLTVDGTGEAWKARQLDDDEGLSFAFSNDGQNLYLFVQPHTRWNKDQLQGVYGQDLTIWLDPGAGKEKKLGIKLAAPAGSMAPAAREVQLVGVDTSSIVGQPEVVIGDTDQRGGLEARIPLSYLGVKTPKRLTVGLETSAPKSKPLQKPRTSTQGKDSPFGGSQDSGAGGGGASGGGRHGRGGGRRPSAPQAETFDPIGLWIRVDLARPASH